MQTVSIFIDTEFESNNMITGNFLQVGMVAFLDGYKEPTDYNLSWKVDSICVSFLDQNKQKEESVMNFWNKNEEIRQRILSEAVEITEGFCRIEDWLIDLSQRYIIKDFVSGIANVDYAWFRNLFLTHSRNQFNLPFKSICCYSMLETLKLLGVRKEGNFLILGDYNIEYKSSILKHTHYALDDAIEETYSYLKIRELLDFISFTNGQKDVFKTYEVKGKIRNL